MYNDQRKQPNQSLRGRTMKRWISVFALVLAMFVGVGDKALGVVGQEVGNQTMQEAAAATGNGTEFKVLGFQYLSIDVTGTFVGTLDFEKSYNGKKWLPLTCWTRDTAAKGSTSTTAVGDFSCDVAGIHSVRTPVSAFTSGSITSIGRSLSQGEVTGINPDVIRPVVGTVTHAAVSVLTSSTSVLAASSVPRLLVVLVNDGVNTIYCNLTGGAAVLNQGVRINDSGGNLLLDVAVMTDQIFCIAETSTTVMLVTEGT